MTGGLGTLIGPIIGAVFVVVVPELLRFAKVYYYLIFGVILIGIALFAPKGIMGLVERLRDWLKGRFVGQ